jgi:hypothetical protein
VKDIFVEMASPLVQSRRTNVARATSFLPESIGNEQETQVVAVPSTQRFSAAPLDLDFPAAGSDSNPSITSDSDYSEEEDENFDYDQDPEELQAYLTALSSNLPVFLRTTTRVTRATRHPNLSTVPDV